MLNTVYEWTNDNTSIGLPASGTGDIGGFTLINSGTVNQVATISVDPVLTGCTGIIQQFQITVKPVPTVAVLPISQTICHDEPTIPVDFSGNISGASYDWTHSNISIGIGSPGFGDIPTFTAINTGVLTQTSDFTVTPSFNGCTGETEIFSITVEPKPTVFLIQVKNGVVEITRIRYYLTGILVRLVQHTTGQMIMLLSAYLLQVQVIYSLLSLKTLQLMFKPPQLQWCQH